MQNAILEYNFPYSLPTEGRDSWKLNQGLRLGYSGSYDKNKHLMYVFFLTLKKEKSFASTRMSSIGLAEVLGHVTNVTHHLKFGPGSLFFFF